MLLVALIDVAIRTYYSSYKNEMATNFSVEAKKLSHGQHKLPNHIDEIQNNLTENKAIVDTKVHEVRQAMKENSAKIIKLEKQAVSGMQELRELVQSEKDNLANFIDTYKKYKYKKTVILYL